MSHHISRLQLCIFLNGFFLVSGAVHAQQRIEWGSGAQSQIQQQSQLQKQPNADSFQKGPAQALKQNAQIAPAGGIQARLKAAGLDRADPAFAAKHQAKLLSSTKQYVRINTGNLQTQNLTNAQKFSSEPLKRNGMGNAVISSNLSKDFSNSNLQAVLHSLYKTQPISQAPAFDGEHKYVAMLSSNSKYDDVEKMFPKKMNSKYSFLSDIKVTSACGNFSQSALLYELNRGGAPNVFQVRIPPNDGVHSLYLVDLSHFPPFNFGNTTQNLTVTLAGPLYGSFTLPATSPKATVNVMLTVDATPTLFSHPLGWLIPSENKLFKPDSEKNSGITQSSTRLANPGARRLDPATNPNANTSGEDLLGYGLELGNGWSLVTTRITSSQSILDLPNNNDADNVYRGATISQMPAGGRLQTGVRWHYGYGESLSYTIQWILKGPYGQRPLKTMPLSGPCDS